MGVGAGGVRRARRVLSLAFTGRYLLATNCVLCGSLSAVGELAQQAARRAGKRCDAKRAGQMALAGVPTGVLTHYWYIGIDRFLTGKTIGVAMKKVVLDQLFFSPVMWLLFLGSFTLLQAQDGWRLWERLRTVGTQMYAAEWLVWPPAQVVNFYLVPLRFRVLYDNTVSLGFDCYTAELLHDEDDD